VNPCRPNEPEIIPRIQCVDYVWKVSHKRTALSKIGGEEQASVRISLAMLRDWMVSAGSAAIQLQGGMQKFLRGGIAMPVLTGPGAMPATAHTFGFALKEWGLAP